MSVGPHLPPLPLSYGAGTKALWSKEPNGKLLVFVHGFGGNALTTWGLLPVLLSIRKEVKGYDIVFFGYESLKLNAYECAEHLQKCLDDLLSKKKEVAHESIRNHDPAYVGSVPRTYREMVLVGHSLGACVIRRAMLNEVRSGEGSWPTRTKMIWFAPAHCGARVILLLTAVSLNLQVKGLSQVAEFFCPSLKDLTPKSDFLKELLDETTDVCKTDARLISRLTIRAKNDLVVLNKPFAKDRTPAVSIAKASHMSVCKPKGFDGALMELLRHL